VYGYPGDGINGIMGALERADGLSTSCRCGMAAFMACAHAKFTAEVGVCMATSGPKIGDCRAAERTLRLRFKAGVA
jgi:pyruvate dehydrogenase (quinone)